MEVSMPRLFATVLVALLPLLAAAQEAAQPPAPPTPPPDGPAPAQPQGTPAPPQGTPPPPQYIPPPPPQYTPPPPPRYAPPSRYAPPPRYAQGPSYLLPPQTRDTWYIGFGIGVADGTVKDALGNSSFSEYLGQSPTTAAFNFKVGTTLTSRLLLGLDISGVSSSAYYAGGSATLDIANYDAVATFFPAERGFFLRAGAGLSRLTLDVTGFASQSFGGANITAGAGHAWWIGRWFNLTVNLDYSAQFYGDHNGGTTGPQRSEFWALGLGFDWY
jgi:hypothetical protein